ncbi:MAG: helix-hairpin-helix domain-containing protein [Dysgonamonadaceae bacterium]|jgi:DNA uptake protein ComE-like DNA-binding protein|nr:helix-hairpin-helix domain-containing protein [Dysgonamonadaceae bacterium]
MWKDFFYFTHNERQGILFLIVFVAGIFVGKFFFTPKFVPVDIFETTEQITTKEQYPSEHNKVKQTPINKQTASVKPVKSSQQSESRTYYHQQEQPVQRTQNQYPVQNKYPKGTVIELNTADTTKLKMIPGIGSSFAKKIVGYRGILGGYYSKEQLQEVYGMYAELYDKIVPYFHIDTTLITPIAVNTALLDRLKAHPYLDFYQAKAIIELRKKRSKINSIGDLELLEEFTQENLEKIRHYLDFH